MAAPYLIGIDGGGSGTRARLTDGSGRVLGLGSAGPSGLTLGVDSAWVEVESAIEQCFASAGMPAAPRRQCALGLGLAGANVRMQAQRFLGRAGDFAHLVLETDAAAMLLGAFGGKPGVVVAAGTGSVGEALRPDGSRASVGGWGFPVGDEGSGAWLGLGAVRAAQWALDGRAPRGALAEAVLREVGEEAEALLAWCAQAGQGAYARLAPYVFASAASDPIAAGLVRAAVVSIAEMADALDPGGVLPLAICGSIGVRLAAQLPARFAGRLREPEGDAIDGALLLARRAADGGRPAAALGVAHDH
jgi:glucosamine kinase